LQLIDFAKPSLLAWDDAPVSRTVTPLPNLAQKGLDLFLLVPYLLSNISAMRRFRSHAADHAQKRRVGRGVCPWRRDRDRVSGPPWCAP